MCNNPEYADLENMYNQPNQHRSTNKPSAVTGTGNKGVWNQAYVKSKHDRQTNNSHHIDSSALEGHRGKAASEGFRGSSSGGHRGGTNQTDILVGKGVSRPNSAKVKTDRNTHSAGKRPTSGKTQLAYTPTPSVSSISAYLQLKKSGKLGQTTSMKDNYRK